MGTKDKTIADLWEKVNATHDLVLQLNTRFNGGPGSWPACQQHATQIADHESRMRAVERRVWMAVGVVALVAVLAAAAEIYTATKEAASSKPTTTRQP